MMMIPTLVAISMIVFVIIQLPPGDYIETHLVVNLTGFPAHETDGTVLYTGGTAGSKDSFDHTGLTNDTVFELTEEAICDITL